MPARRRSASRGRGFSGQGGPGRAFGRDAGGGADTGHRLPRLASAVRHGCATGTDALVRLLALLALASPPRGPAGSRSPAGGSASSGADAERGSSSAVGGRTGLAGSSSSLVAAGGRLIKPVGLGAGWWTHAWTTAVMRGGGTAQRALGRWTDLWERGVGAGARAAYRFVAGWTQACAGAAASVPSSARTGIGSWTDAWAKAVPTGGRGLLRGTAWAQQQAAVGARLLTDRVVPAMVVFALLAAAAVTWVLLVTSATVPALGKYDDVAQWAFDLPEDTALPHLPQRSVIHAADGTSLAVLHDEQDRRIVPLDRLPSHVWQAVIAAEDRRFFEHDGYDVEAIGRAAVANLRARDIVQGGSTITQQLAKQNFLSGEQTFQRKAAELTYAMALEERLSKKELLERYLNQVYFGAGAYGIASGAEEWFGVEAEELRPEQAALLGGLIRAPSRLDPRERPELATERRNAVLAAMGEEGYLTPEEAARARETPVEVLPHREREVREPYVVEEVKRAFFTNPAFGDTRAERIEYLFEGGLEVHTTIEPRLQNAAHHVVRKAFPEGGSERTAAIAAVDPRSGQTLAFHSGTDFEAEQFDLATQGRRQPGSAFKLFVLTTHLEQGGSIDDIIDGSAPREFDWDEHQEPWEVRNFGGASFGPLTLREALVNSVNTAFAELILDVGIGETVRTAQRFGIDADEAFGPASARGPAIAIGGLNNGVTTREMASAVGTLATGGQRVEPYVIERVVGPDGEDVYRHNPERKRVVSEQTAGTMIHTMQEVVRRGTGANARIPGRSIAGKTGTSQEFADAWFVGTTPTLSAAAWVGNPAGRVPYPGMTGGSAVAPVWREFMVLALHGIEPRPFDLPPPPPTAEPENLSEPGEYSEAPNG